jgi:hypothetical protein
VTKITELLFSWHSVLIAFSSFAILSVIRKLGIKKDSTNKVIGGLAQNKIFQMGLPLYPYILTIGLVFTPGFPLPDGLPKIFVVKILFGIWTGWLSGYSFQIVKKFIEKGFDIKFNEP